MRTYIRMILLLLVSATMLCLFTHSSCDNGTGSEENESIVGTWRLVDVIMKDTPVGELSLTAENFLELSGTGATSSTLQFNEDGSASLTTTYADSSEEVVPGSWTIDGDKVILVGVGIDDTVPYDVDGNTLTLTITLPIDFDSDGTAEDTKIDMIYNRV